MTSEGELTAVVVHFDVEGKITPRRFTWQGTQLTVEGVGRRWREKGERCFTVLAAGRHLFELRLDEEAWRWRVARGPTPKMVV